MKPDFMPKYTACGWWATIATVDCSGITANPSERYIPIVVEPEEAPDLLVLGLVRAGRVAPRVAPALVEVDSEPAPYLRVQPLGEALGGLHAEPVGVELLGELAVALELRHQVGDLGADGHALEGHHVALAESESIGRKKSDRQMRSCFGWRGKLRRSSSREGSSGSNTTSSLPSAAQGK